jgi:hypothetical protein
VGSDDFNLRISRLKAQPVARELEQEGLKPAVVTGIGKPRLVAGNDSDEGRARNRRVEVWLRREDRQRSGLPPAPEPQPLANLQPQQVGAQIRLRGC